MGTLAMSRYGGRAISSMRGLLGRNVTQTAGSSIESTAATTVSKELAGMVVSKGKEGVIEAERSLSKHLANPLEGTTYTKKVLEQMSIKSGKSFLPGFHGFPLEVDNFARLGRTEIVTGGDGILRTKVLLEGGYQGRIGHFEWMVEADKSINHRLFIPKQ
jgi:hypothetical protein